MLFIIYHLFIKTTQPLNEAVSQFAKRFEQKSEVNNEIKDYMQKVIRALKEI